MQTTVPNERHRTENDHTFFDVTLWGMFDRFSSVGVEYQHKRLKKKREVRQTQRKPGGQETGWVFFGFLLKIEDPPTHTLRGSVAHKIEVVCVFQWC